MTEICRLSDTLGAYYGNRKYQKRESARSRHPGCFQRRKVPANRREIYTKQATGRLACASSPQTLGHNGVPIAPGQVGSGRSAVVRRASVRSALK